MHERGLTTTNPHIYPHPAWLSRWDREAWIKGFETARTEECYELEGAVPKDLDGTLFRNGHAKFDVNVRLCLLRVVASIDLTLGC